LRRKGTEESERTKMSNSRENHKRKAMSDVKIVLCALIACVLLCVLPFAMHRIMRSRRGGGLSGLEKAMEIYGKDYDDELPPAEDATGLKPRARIEATKLRKE